MGLGFGSCRFRIGISLEVLDNMVCLGSLGFRVWGLGFRRVWGLGFGVADAQHPSSIQALGFRV